MPRKNRAHIYRKDVGINPEDEINPRELKYLQLKKMFPLKSDGELMREAGYSDSTSRGKPKSLRLREKIAVPLREFKEEYASVIPNSRIIQKHSDLLDAKKTIVVDKQPIEVDDNQTQMEAVKVGYKILGVTEPKDEVGIHDSNVVIQYQYGNCKENPLRSPQPNIPSDTQRPDSI